MKEVHIRFSNIQSHENTSFILKPGLNFILANDNNVGKTTIFTVLSEIAKAPNNKLQKLSRIVRTGCAQGSASFEFLCNEEVERVTAWFVRDGVGGKLFFEHDAGGVVTRSIQCPKSLLDALGIVISDNEGLINFNDADSVQLVARASPESDSIITRVMTDERVETVKHNAASLYKEVSGDHRLLGVQLQNSERLVEDLEYVPEVEEFFESVDELEGLARLADIFSNIAGVTPPTVKELDGLDEVRRILEVCRALLDVDYTAFTAPRIGEVDINNLRALIELSRRLEPLVAHVRQLKRERWELEKTEAELANARADIASTCKRVVCPIRGEVFYTDEKCIPSFD